MSGHPQSQDAALLQVLSGEGAEAGSTPMEVPGAGGEHAVPSGPAVAPEHAAHAADGSTAAQMRAHLARMQAQSERDFPVPGWGGRLVLRARLLGNREWRPFSAGGGMTDADFIDRSTTSLRFLRDDGSWEDIPGFGHELAACMGMPPETPSARLVAAVLGDMELRVHRLARRILDWQLGEADAIEAALGE